MKSRSLFDMRNQKWVKPVCSDGVCGLDLGFNDKTKPLLIQDAEIEGFATGTSKAGHGTGATK